MPRRYLKSIQVELNLVSFNNITEQLELVKNEYQAKVLKHQSDNVEDTALYRLELTVSVLPECNSAQISKADIDALNGLSGDKTLTFKLGVSAEVVRQILGHGPKVAHLDLEQCALNQSSLDTVNQFLNGNMEIISLKFNGNAALILTAATNSSLVELGGRNITGYAGKASLTSNNAPTTEDFDLCFDMFGKFTAAQQSALQARSTSDVTDAATKERSTVSLNTQEATFLHANLGKFVAFVYKMSTENTDNSSLHAIAETIGQATIEAPASAASAIQAAAQRLVAQLPKPQVSVVVQDQDGAAQVVELNAAQTEQALRQGQAENPQNAVDRAQVETEEAQARTVLEQTQVKDLETQVRNVAEQTQVKAKLDILSAQEDAAWNALMQTQVNSAEVAQQATTRRLAEEAALAQQHDQRAAQTFHSTDDPATAPLLPHHDDVTVDAAGKCSIWYYLGCCSPFFGCGE